MENGPFEKLLSETLAARDRSPSTQETYGWALRGFGRFVDKPLDKVVPEDIQAYQRHLVTERKVGFSAFNQATCALRFFYRQCLEKDWPIERMPYQRKRRGLPEILSPQEVAAVFEACSNLKHKALLMTSYSGGLRLGETLGLLPSDIDSQRMMIRVEQGKGRKDRYVMLSDVLLKTLRQYFKTFRPVRWLFKGKTKGEPLSASTAEKVFKLAAGRASVAKNVSFHSLRHAFATHLLEGGTTSQAEPREAGSPRVGADEWQHPGDPGPLGHRSLTTTQVYTHVAQTYVNSTKSPLDQIQEVKKT